ncbi:hypothetical protein K438DRAFT_1749372 [Mycena galopus ATCC 62051]|nr:hypothetical protein K438DRAFT_1749372 [Mycena galopus ATCC 62051]
MTSTLAAPSLPFFFCELQFIPRTRVTDNPFLILLLQLGMGWDGGTHTLERLDGESRWRRTDRSRLAATVFCLWVDRVSAYGVDQGYTNLFVYFGLHGVATPGLVKEADLRGSDGEAKTGRAWPRVDRAQRARWDEMRLRWGTMHCVWVLWQVYLMGRTRIRTSTLEQGRGGGEERGGGPWVLQHTAYCLAAMLCYATLACSHTGVHVDGPRSSLSPYSVDSLQGGGLCGGEGGVVIVSFGMGILKRDEAVIRPFWETFYIFFWHAFKSNLWKARVELHTLGEVKAVDSAADSVADYGRF